MREEVITFGRGTEARLNIRVNPQRRSLKVIFLLFIEPFATGARDSEKYFNSDITKVHVTINGSPNRIYNNGINGKDMWTEISRFFGTKNNVRWRAKYESDQNTSLTVSSVFLSICVQWLTQAYRVTAYASLTPKTASTLRLKEWPLAVEK